MDREKVIEGFEICDNNEDGIVCKNCPYKEDKWNGAWEDETGKTCFQTLHADVLALLKEQERLLRKKQKDINKLCADYSNLKHRFHEKTELIRCKDCKHFEIKDYWADFNGVPILATSDCPTCNKWADGCKTKPDGYCFMAERRD